MIGLPVNPQRRPVFCSTILIYAGWATAAYAGQPGQDRMRYETRAAAARAWHRKQARATNPVIMLKNWIRYTYYLLAGIRTSKLAIKSDWDKKPTRVRL